MSSTTTTTPTASTVNNNGNNNTYDHAPYQPRKAFEDAVPASANPHPPKHFGSEHISTGPKFVQFDITTDGFRSYGLQVSTKPPLFVKNLSSSNHQEHKEDQADSHETISSPTGLFVLGVVDQSPAAACGQFHPGDRIAQVDGNPVHLIEHLFAVLASPGTHSIVLDTAHRVILPNQYPAPTSLPPLRPSNNSSSHVASRPERHFSSNSQIFSSGDPRHPSTASSNIDGGCDPRMSQHRFSVAPEKKQPTSDELWNEVMMGATSDPMYDQHHVLSEQPVIVELVKGRLGLGFELSHRNGSNDCVISAIMNKGAAAEAKNLCVGDRLMAVNGLDVRTFPFKMVISVLKSLPYGPFSLIVLRRAPLVDPERIPVFDSDFNFSNSLQPALLNIPAHYAHLGRGSNERLIELNVRIAVREPGSIGIIADLYDEHPHEVGRSFPVVSAIASGSPAFVQGGVFIGDEIVSINGSSLTGKNGISIQRTLDNISPGVYNLCLRRIVDSNDASPESLVGGSPQVLDALVEKNAPMTQPEPAIPQIADLNTRTEIIPYPALIRSQSPTTSETPVSLRFRLSKRTPPALRVHRLGLVLGVATEYENGYSVFVEHLVQGSLAEVDGRLRPGDLLKSVNGFDLRGVTTASIAYQKLILADMAAPCEDNHEFVISLVCLQRTPSPQHAHHSQQTDLPRTPADTLYGRTLASVLDLSSPSVKGFAHLAASGIDAHLSTEGYGRLCARLKTPAHGCFIHAEGRMRAGDKLFRIGDKTVALLSPSQFRELAYYSLASLPSLLSLSTPSLGVEYLEHCYLIPSSLSHCSNAHLGEPAALVHPDLLRRVTVERSGIWGLGLKLINKMGHSMPPRIGLFVREVLSGSDAQNKLHVGDQLIEINGHSLLDYPFDEALKLIMKQNPPWRLKIIDAASYRKSLSDQQSSSSSSMSHTDKTASDNVVNDGSAMHSHGDNSSLDTTVVAQPDSTPSRLDVDQPRETIYVDHLINECEIVFKHNGQSQFLIQHIFTPKATRHKDRIPDGFNPSYEPAQYVDRTIFSINSVDISSKTSLQLIEYIHSCPSGKLVLVVSNPWYKAQESNNVKQRPNSTESDHHKPASKDDQETSETMSDVVRPFSAASSDSVRNFDEIKQKMKVYGDGVETVAMKHTVGDCEVLLAFSKAPEAESKRSIFRVQFFFPSVYHQNVDSSCSAKELSRFRGWLLISVDGTDLSNLTQMQVLDLIKYAPTGTLLLGVCPPPTSSHNINPSPEHESSAPLVHPAPAPAVKQKVSTEGATPPVIHYSSSSDPRSIVTIRDADDESEEDEDEVEA